MAFNVEIIGVAAAIFTTAAFVPQVYKTYKSKSVNELSLGMYLVFLTGLVLWLTYGILINSFAIMLANTITTMLVMVLIYFILKYKK